MFDPSKLNLEVDDNKDKENKENTQEIKPEEILITQENNNLRKPKRS